MVDEYASIRFRANRSNLVQIPLWSMNTNCVLCPVEQHIRFRFLYGRWILGHLVWNRLVIFVQIPLWSMNTDISDTHLPGLLHVQIPLWSMNTGGIEMTLSKKELFRFLYGRWIPALQGIDSNPFSVQIPLWSMNTRHTCPPNRRSPGFRFLYGRWIHELFVIVP